MLNVLQGYKYFFLGSYNLGYLQLGLSPKKKKKINMLNVLQGYVGHTTWVISKKKTKKNLGYLQLSIVHVNLFL